MTRATVALAVASTVGLLAAMTFALPDAPSKAQPGSLLFPRPKPVAAMSLAELERFQVAALSHYRGAWRAHERVADRRPLSRREWTHRRWYRKAMLWTARELREARERLHPRIVWRQTVAAWLPTFYCENGGYGWAANTGNGFYGGLQFDHGTWKAHGGHEFASEAHLASPAQQALVASRLTYDGWPNCPNP